MLILDYVIYRIVAVILEMFWDKTVLGSWLYNTRGYMGTGRFGHSTSSATLYKDVSRPWFYLCCFMCYL